MLIGSGSNRFGEEPAQSQIKSEAAVQSSLRVG
jgi:hypothetical protein